MFPKATDKPGAAVSSASLDRTCRPKETGICESRRSLMLNKFLDLITSLKLTIVCLAAGMALIFAGTLAQVHLGIHEAQQRYFQSMFVWWPPEGPGFQIPIFPGGHLIGAVLLINLIAAHLKRFRWSWRKLGIHLTHAGLIIN